MSAPKGAGAKEGDGGGGGSEGSAVGGVFGKFLAFLDAVGPKARQAAAEMREAASMMGEANDVAAGGGEDRTATMGGLASRARGEANVKSTKIDGSLDANKLVGQFFGGRGR